MGIEIRNAAPDEFAAAIDVISTAFLERPDPGAVAASVAETWDPARTWVAFDGDRACGTFRSWPTRLTVPGGADAARRRRLGGDRPAHATDGGGS